MIKKIVITFLFIIFSFVTVFVTFISKPEWFLSENIIKKAKSIFLPESDQLHWDNYAFSTTTNDHGIKKLNISFKNFCYFSQEIGIKQICFESIDLMADMKMGLFTPGERLSFSKVELLGGTGEIVEAAKSVEEKSSNNEMSLHEINEQAYSVTKLIQRYIKGSFKIEITKLNIRDEINIEARVRGLDDIQVTVSDYQERLPSSSLQGRLVFKEKTAHLKADVVLNLDQKQKISLALKKEISKDLSIFETLEIKLNYESMNQVASLELKGAREELLVQNIMIKEKGAFIVDAPLCKMAINQDNLFDLIGLSCKKFNVKLTVKDKTKKTFYINGNVKAYAKNILIGKVQTSAALDIVSDLSIEKFSKVKLVIKDDFVFGQKELKYPNFNLSLESQNIQEFYPYLKPYSLVPPAPFYDLEGKVELLAHNDDVHDEISFSLLTDLTSKNQKMNIKATGMAYPNDKNIEAEVLFKNVKLVAPDINLLKKFAIFPSSTISKSKKVFKVKNKVKKDVFNYKIKLLTENPILIKNTITSEPIPVNLNLTLGEAMEGVVSIKSYNLELFRRSAFIDYAKLKQDGAGNEQVDAKIRVDHAQYKVYITIVGSPQSPNVIFESVPPLSRDNIISVLLYGRPLDEGSVDEASSVANTSMALSDKLMGAASLFLFASTPINSVRYDPESESVRASFNLGSSTTLSVGSAGNDNMRDYSIQKKLGDNLYFDTELINDTLQDESYLVGMLKWIMRY